MSATRSCGAFRKLAAWKAPLVDESLAWLKQALSDRAAAERFLRDG